MGASPPCLASQVNALWTWRRQPPFTRRSTSLNELMIGGYSTRCRRIWQSFTVCETANCAGKWSFRAPSTRLGLVPSTWLSKDQFTSGCWDEAGATKPEMGREPEMIWKPPLASCWLKSPRAKLWQEGWLALSLVGESFKIQWEHPGF